jgi:transcriptional regulator with XRE-family HTH domain
MDASKAGRSVRALRVRANLRQADVEEAAGVPRAVVARIERGDIARVRFGQLLAVAASLHADLELFLRWNGTDLDRLLNAGHSAMHEVVAAMLLAASWETVPERSLSIWGERGVIDIVAWHAATRTLLVVELKTEIVDVQRLIGTVDRYRRLAPEIAKDLGWKPDRVGVWVAVSNGTTSRRRLAEHGTVLRAAFPTDGRTVPGWLRNPTGSLRALSFISDARVAHRIAARSSRRRVRSSPTASTDAPGHRRDDQKPSPRSG